MKGQVLVILFAIATFGRAQTEPFKYFITPSLSLGYTFGAKINYGFSIDAGLLQKIDKQNVRVGMSFCYYFVKTSRHIHRLRSTNILVGTDFAKLRMGVGRARNRRGYGKRNACIVHGINYDVSATVPNIPNAPWVGIRQFDYPRAQWAWFNRPYNSLFIECGYTFVLPLKAFGEPAVKKQ